jgi:hypothetical protein
VGLEMFMLYAGSIERDAIAIWVDSVPVDRLKCDDGR